LLELSICDVIWENSVYGGTKRTGSDQTCELPRLTGALTR